MPRIQLPGLTGIPGDDALAIGAGTGQKISAGGGGSGSPATVSISTAVTGNADQPGMSSGLRFSGGGVRVVREKLNAHDGFLIPDSNADQHVGLQAFLTAVGTALGGKGGAGVIPPGIIHMGSGTVVFPSAHSCDIEGALGWSGPSYQDGGTVLQWDADASGPPHTTFGVDMRPCQTPSLRNIALKSLARFAYRSGNLNCCMAGVAAGGRSYLERIAIDGFSTGIGYGGVVGGTSYGFDHSSLRSIYTSTTGYGINFLPGSISNGDQHFYDLNIQANCAAMAIAAGSGFIGSLISGGGLLAPIGVYPYQTVPNTGVVFGWNVISGVSFETSGDGVILNPFQQGGVNDNDFHRGFYNTPSMTYGNRWSGTFAVAASAGTSLTVTDGTGFAFEPGMTVVGTGVPAGTIILSVAGTWPWAAPVLTLNNAVTSPTSVVIGMPHLGAVVAGAITNNQVSGTMMNLATGLPYFVAGKSILNNTVHDGAGAYQAAQASNLAVCSNRAWGNRWGNGVSVGIISAQLNSGLSCQAGDLLQRSIVGNPMAGMLEVCDGSRRPVGAAMAAAPAVAVFGAPVDYQYRAQGSVHGGIGYQALVNNRSATPIAPYALLKVDVVNPGGVTTATSMSDGLVVGCNGSAIIAAGATGRADELWM